MSACRLEKTVYEAGRARIIYHSVTTREPYDESIFTLHEQHHRERKTRRLRAQAAALGYHVPTTAT